MIKKLKRLPIPEDKLSILSDWSVPTIDRVALAEQCRKTYDYCISDMVNMLKSSFATYNGLCRVLQSGADLHEKLRSGEVSINEAIMKVDYPERARERCQYRFLFRVNSIGGEIIYQDDRHILYRYGESVFLGVVYGYYDKAEAQYSYKEMLYLLDDRSCVIDAITNLIAKGYIIDKSMAVHKKREASNYRLTHYIVAAYNSDVPLDVIKKAKVTMNAVSQGDSNTRDLRISNLRCRAVPNHIAPEYTGGFVVQRYPKNEIKIINHNTGAVITADYSEWLYGLLQQKKDYLKLQSRDNRLCVPICGSIEYLYHICIAVHLYGVPRDEEDLSKILGDFRGEYLSKKMQVDHLDNDCSNNRLCNLIVMTQSQHSKKQSFEANMKSLGLPYFCWAERHDDTALTVRAGILDVLKPPIYRLHGVYSLDEYLAAAEQFARAAREECAVCDAFEELEREENGQNGKQEEKD